MVAAVAQRAARAERAVLVTALAVVAVALNADTLRSDVVSGDALVHHYWMWQFRDADLFTDGLTADLRESARYPVGYVALFRLASQVVDPIVFGEWLGVALMVVSGALTFEIVREHSSWRPAAWIAAGVFAALADIHRFPGGFARAFLPPVVLLTVLLALRRRDVPAALVAGGGALLYPPAALLAVGILLVSAMRGRVRRPRLDRRRAALAVLAVAVMLLAVAVPRLVAGDRGSVTFTAAEARVYPEFRSGGALDFFEESTLAYLRGNRSGFDLRGPGSIVVLAALALLAVRRDNVRLLRREVLAMPVVALVAYALAQALLFRLYLPHRYTYPIVGFCVVVIGTAILPTWTSLTPRKGSWWRPFALLTAPLATAAIAVYVFPLGPTGALAVSPATVVIVGMILLVIAGMALLLARAPSFGPSVGAALTGLLLVAAMVTSSERLERGKRCPERPVMRYLASLPQNVVLAGDPLALNCVPFTARRAVVISRKLAWSYEVEYFFKARARMFAALRAYYGPDPQAIVDLRDRYGATHLWVRRRMLTRAVPQRARKVGGPPPYGPFVRRLLRSGRPAALSLPPKCRTWAGTRHEVYRIGCIAAERATGAPS